MITKYNWTLPVEGLTAQTSSSSSGKAVQGAPSQQQQLGQQQYNARNWSPPVIISAAAVNQVDEQSVTRKWNNALTANAWSGCSFQMKQPAKIERTDQYEAKIVRHEDGSRLLLLRAIGQLSAMGSGVLNNMWLILLFTFI